MGELYFDIAAAVIIALNIFIFYYKKFLYTLQTKVFKILVWFTFFATLFDIFGVVLNRNSTEVPMWALYLVNTLFYLCLNVIPVLFGFYIVVLTDKIASMKTSDKLLFIAPFITAFLIICANPFTKTVFFFDKDLAYARGPGLTVLYGLSLLYIALGVGLTYSARKALPERTASAVYGFVLVSFLALVIQFFKPDLLLQCLGLALSGLLTLLTVQNPDDFIDSSTGLFNRNGFVNQINLFRNNKRHFHIVLIVVENASYLRRTFGLPFFASTMRGISLYLAKMIRADRIAACLGEAKFALVLNETGSGSKIKDSIKGIQDRFRLPWIIGGNPITLSARFCDIRFPEEIGELSDVFECLEQLTNATRPWEKGKIVHIGDLGLMNKKREAEVELAIKRGLAHDAFQVFYQPIFSVAEQRIISAEALLRLFDDELGPIPPDEFIPISERNGSILDIGSFVIDRACAFFHDNDLEARGLEFMEINLSVAQCIQHDLDALVTGTCEKHGLRSDQVCLEITESTAASSPEKFTQNLKALSKKGFIFALDDYGTGYSNINNLLELPFTLTKLDRSIVAARFKSLKGLIMLESTIDMLKRMNMKIVAEGVETGDQVKVLTDLGCDLLQGYYFSRPVCGDDFLKLLKVR